MAVRQFRHGDVCGEGGLRVRQGGERRQRRDEDEQPEQEQRHEEEEETAPAPIKKGLFAPSAASGRATGFAARKAQEDADEVESVEESIPEVEEGEEEEDGMSVGAVSPSSLL